MKFSIAPADHAADSPADGSGALATAPESRDLKKGQHPAAPTDETAPAAEIPAPEGAPAPDEVPAALLYAVAAVPALVSAPTTVAPPDHSAEDDAAAVEAWLAEQEKVDPHIRRKWAAWLAEQAAAPHAEDAPQ